MELIESWLHKRDVIQYSLQWQIRDDGEIKEK